MLDSEIRIQIPTQFPNVSSVHNKKKRKKYRNHFVASIKERDKTSGYEKYKKVDLTFANVI